jgi:hypothetical protein
MNNLVISAVANSVFFNNSGATNLENLPIPSNVKTIYWNTTNSTGWIENLDDNGNYIGNTDITDLPSWASECLTIFQSKFQPVPTPTPQENCKIKAEEILVETDWSEIPSVSDVTNNPYLINVSDFIDYRVAIRGLAVNPVESPVWPTMPTAQWSS